MERRHYRPLMFLLGEIFQYITSCLVSEASLVQVTCLVLRFELGPLDAAVSATEYAASGV